MSLSNLTLLAGATIAVSGGTAQTFAPEGTQVNRGIQVADVAVDDITERTVCVFKNTSGALQPNGTFSKDRRTAKISIPELLEDGTLDYATLEVTLIKSPRRGATTVAALKNGGAQLIVDADTSNFWLMGATS